MIRSLSHASRVFSAAFTAASLLVATACGPAAGPSSGFEPCETGRTVRCACEGGALGFQTCADDGAYGPCTCGDDIDADQPPDATDADPRSDAGPDTPDAPREPDVADAEDTQDSAPSDVTEADTTDAPDEADAPAERDTQDVADSSETGAEDASDADDAAPSDTADGRDAPDTFDAGDGDPFVDGGDADDASAPDPAVVEPVTLWINELHYNGVGVDLDEFVEIAGPAGASLAGWQLLRIGSGGGRYGTPPALPSTLSGRAGSGEIGFAVVYFAADSLNNAAGSGLMLVRPGGTIAQYLTVGGVIVDAPANSASPATPFVTSRGIPSSVAQTDATALGSSIQLQGTGCAYEDFRWVAVAGSRTPGDPNQAQATGCIGDAAGAGYVRVEPSATVPSAFLAARTEVTQGEWQSITGVNPSVHSDCGPRCPVTNVSWYAALQYANELSRRQSLTPCYGFATPACDAEVRGWADGRSTCSDEVTVIAGCDGYRLPSSAEWVRAARGGTSNTFYWGSTSGASIVAVYAWFSGATSPPPASPREVGLGVPNPFGLFDTSGNVAEWTFAAGAIPGTALTASGSYTSPTGDLRPSDTEERRRDATAADVGLRLVRSLR